MTDRGSWQVARNRSPTRRRASWPRVHDLTASYAQRQVGHRDAGSGDSVSISTVAFPAAREPRKLLLQSSVAAPNCSVHSSYAVALRIRVGLNLLQIRLRWVESSISADWGRHRQTFSADKRRLWSVDASDCAGLVVRLARPSICRLLATLAATCVNDVAVQPRGDRYDPRPNIDRTCSVCRSGNWPRGRGSRP